MVLIVAKCIVYEALIEICEVMADVLIVAKCIVNNLPSVFIARWKSY